MSSAPVGASGFDRMRAAATNNVRDLDLFYFFSVFMLGFFVVV